MDFKISVLVFLRDEADRLLLIERKKEPNKGTWSPIGGKLEMAQGESPHQCAVRETFEEVGLKIEASDLHLFAMISEKAYEGSTNWLMFAFDCRKKIPALPQDIDEGKFKFFARSEIENLKIPETDRVFIWRFFDQFRDKFSCIRVDCTPQRELHAIVEEQV